MIVRHRRRDRGEHGASAIELALYMPLLISAILLAVQFSLIYLGNQAASAAAREAARIARVSGDTALGEQKGYDFAGNIGDGVLENVEVTVDPIGTTEVRAVVSGEAQQLLPFFPPPRVREQVQGPIERFIPDGTG